MEPCACEMYQCLPCVMAQGPLPRYLHLAGQACEASSAYTTVFLTFVSFVLAPLASWESSSRSKHIPMIKSPPLSSPMRIPTIDCALSSRRPSQS
ncbi:hypothetical protein CDV31_006565 [Fusarium ambrosium]|uniref:Uncharacterized protein n=1 Tax=Fusarium ambrosium TaxID=131363 RepID=A0A428UBX4_9HYPO|nr:hypothetical protein CDV31_006565 [Fusarium ambrosium]